MRSVWNKKDGDYGIDKKVLQLKQEVKTEFFSPY